MDASDMYYDNLIRQQENYWESMIRGMERQKSRWEELAEVEEIAEAYSRVQQVFGEMGYTVEDVLNGNAQAFEDFKAKYITILSDLNQNTDFQEGLSYASGILRESFGSIVSDARSAVQQLSGTFSDGTFSGALAGGISEGIISATQELGQMTQLGSDAAEGFIIGWNEKAGEVADAAKQTATDAVYAFAEGQDSHSPSEKYKALAADAVNGLLLGIMENKQTFIDTVRSLAEEGVLAFKEGFNFENSTLNTSFDALRLLIESVTEALGIGREGTVGGLLDALGQLSRFSFREDSIITQFTDFRTAVDEAAAAISGGGESSSGGQNGGSGKGGAKSGGSGPEGGSGGGITGAIEQMGETAGEVIGEPGAEGDGTVIGEFGALETAVTEVTAAIGSGDSENGKKEKPGSGGNEEGEGSLIDSIVSLGETSGETLGEAGGSGVIGRFEQFEEVIEEARDHVEGISTGLENIDGTDVECTIRINIVRTESGGGGGADAGGAEAAGETQLFASMNLDSAAYHAVYGESHAEGTALVSGSWAVQSDERNVLVGEAGRELVVRGGRFFTVGDNGAEMFDIKRGDIVFNHEQTESLLKNGHISGRGKAYADGAVGGGKVLTPEGHILRPLQEGDRGYELMKAFEPITAKISGGGEQLISNAAFEGRKQMERWTKEITSNNVITNIANNIRPTVTIGSMHVTCPGVTEQQVAEQLGNVIGKELNKQFSGFHNYTDQMSRIR